MLNRVQATGGSATDLQKFYTALYHVLLNPNIASDVNGQYRGFDNAIHTATPHRLPELLRLGHLPILGGADRADRARRGDRHRQVDGARRPAGRAAAQVVAQPQRALRHDRRPRARSSCRSMYAFGVRSFDTAAALTLMNASSNGGTTQGSPIRGRQSGYVSAAVHPRGPVGLAGVLGVGLRHRPVRPGAGQHGAVQHLHHPRAVVAQRVQHRVQLHPPAQRRRHLAVAAEPGAARAATPRATPPSTPGWSPYNFAVADQPDGRPADRASSGSTTTSPQLNGGLSAPFFYIGNEPEHGVPWAYNFAALPGRHQSSAVRRVMNESFTTGAGGLPGNDDLGATSAWYVWAALGMYPPTPGADTLALHGPLFPSILIDRPGGDIQINGTAPGRARSTCRASRSTARRLSATGSATPRSPAAPRSRYTMGGSPGELGHRRAATCRRPSTTASRHRRRRRASAPTWRWAGRPPASAACAATEGAGEAVRRRARREQQVVLDRGRHQVPAGRPRLERRTSARSWSSTPASAASTTGWNTGAFNIQTSTDGTNWTTSGPPSRATAPAAPTIQSRRSRPVTCGSTSPRRPTTATAPPASTSSRCTAAAAPARQRGARTRRPRPTPPATPTRARPRRSTAASPAATPTSGARSARPSSGRSTSGHRSRSSPSPSGTPARAARSTTWNTRDFTLQVSSNGTTWTTVATVTGNTASVTNHPITTTTARYVRLNITAPTQTTDNAARIYEVEVYA